MSIFQTVTQDGNARTGLLTLPHGEVKTPAFMPVGTCGAMKALTFEQLEKIGFQIMLSNTYHLYLRPGKEIIEESGGLHSFNSWSKNILTDSGGFQVFSLSDLRKITKEGVKFQSHIDGSRHLFTPESVVEFQTLLGSDIQMVLDVCTPYGINHKEAKEALDITLDWANRAFIHRTKMREDYKGICFPIIQGNFFHDLRQESIDKTLELNPQGLAIGGLSVGEPKDIYQEFLYQTAENIPKNLPLYVMGIGTPDYIFDAVSVGVDIFDCVYPTRIGRNGAAMTTSGLISLKQEKYKFDKEPLSQDCSCSACKRYSRMYIRHLLKSKEILGAMLLTEHNLTFLHSLILEIRRSIEEKRFLQFKNDFLTNYYQK